MARHQAQQQLLPHRTHCTPRVVATQLVLLAIVVLGHAITSDAAKCASTEFVAKVESQFTDCTQYTCQTLATCTKEQYESKAPELIQSSFVSLIGSLCPSGGITTQDFGNNRECSTLLACTSNQYQKTPPQPTTGNYTQNRVCAKTTVCGTNEFQTAKPTLTSNRKCEQLKVCNATEYEVQAPTSVAGMCVHAYGVCYLRTLSVPPYLTPCHARNTTSRVRIQLRAWLFAVCGYQVCGGPAMQAADHMQA